MFSYDDTRAREYTRMEVESGTCSAQNAEHRYTIRAELSYSVDASGAIIVHRVK